MNEPVRYEIVIKGNASTRLLGALRDDFTIEAAEAGTTRMTGTIRDAAHLHGVVTHMTSLAIEIISLARLGSHPTHHPNRKAAMTTTISTSTDIERASSRAGAIGALVAAATFVFGIVLFVTSLSDYTEGDPTPAESVGFLVAHQTTLFAWYLVIFLVFGVAIIPLARALHRRLADVNRQLADIGAVFAYIWAGLMFATGMIHNVGITAVADLEETDPAAAQTLWSSIDTVTEGLGGGNELVGGLWILLVSIAAWGTGRLPTGLNILGAVSAAAALITLIPGLSDVGMIFGLGSIAWFAWTGLVLSRDPDATAPGAEIAR